MQNGSKTGIESVLKMITVNYILVRKCIENDISSDVIFLHFDWSGELLFAAIFWWCVDETHLGLQPSFS